MKKRSFYNIAFGIGSQLLSIALGIIIPRLFLTSFGSEVNGFLNSINQIFAYFALLEAGVGAASLQALYGPVGKGDKESTSEILSATNKYYNKTGIFYFLAVFGLAIVYPIVIKSEMNPLVMAVIILMNGLPGAISYLFQGKYLILLQAEGKNYVNTIALTVVNTTVNITKIVMLLMGCNIIAIQAAYLVLNLLKVLYFWWYFRKNYRWVNLKAKPAFEAIGQKNAAFVNQICDLIFRNTDTIILSLFCDLKVVSVYAMYTLLFSMIRTAMDYVAQGFSFVMGQTFNNDRKKYIKLHDLYQSYRLALIFALYNIAFIFILPFMKLYTAGVTDINYIDYKVAVLFIVFYLLTGARVCEAELINYAQHFKLTQTRCIIEAVINITVSIVCVNLWGIYGVLIGTIVALLYRTNDMIIYANRRILGRSPWVTYKKVISNALVFVAISYVSSLINWNLDSYLAIIMWAIVSAVVIMAVYFAVASIVDVASFKYLVSYLKGFINTKFKKKKA
ncbi:MAG: sugar isomerase [Ruminococcus sp.]|nr:sugar isomerase [Ruminococcus sp.]